MKRRNFIEKTAAGVAAVTVVPRHVLGGDAYSAPNDKLNVGYIGTGKQSFHLCKEITKCPEAVTVAACDVYGTKLDQFAEFASMQHEANGKKAEIRKWHYYREMLEDPSIDAS